MPLILAVDDSSIDRALIGRLIGEEPLHWIVEFADTAEQALVRLRDLAVDVLVTDIMMPGMDGLALLQIVREQYPGLPVILTTGQGNESLAIAALRGGAANYVPKSELAQRLCQTIKQVLDVAKHERNYDHLMRNASTVRFCFDLESDPDQIPPLISLLQQTAARMQLCGRDTTRHIGVAVDEAMINSIYHGNLELPHEDLAAVRARLGDGLPVPSIDERRRESPYCDRRINVDAQFTREQLEITVSDQGSGFDVTASRASFSDAHGQQPESSKRGLVLIRNLMDDVQFNEQGNVLRMIKRREEQPHAQEPLTM